MAGPPVLGGASGAEPARSLALRTLLLLSALNVFNHLDRQLVSILLEPIRNEFLLTDIQLGLLSGLAFAALYTVLGFPAAIWVARRGRINLIAASAVLWGAMTAATGYVQSFAQLLAARVGVGIGEAGCVPAAHAALSDLYPPERRASALSIFSGGVNAGVFVAFLFGGYIGQRYGWRTAFLIAGVATVALAVVLKLAVPEPRRTGTAPGAAGATSGRPRLAEVLAAMWRDPAMRQTLIAATLTSAVGYGALAWLPSFLQRTHGLDLAQAGLYLALVVGIGGALGAWFGGAMSDRLGARDPRWALWFVALVFVGTKPFSIAFYLVDSTALALALFVLPGMAGAIFAGPSVAVLHGRVRPEQRLLASAVFLFLINLIGLGIGPLAVGAMSQTVFSGTGASSLAFALVVMQVAGVWGGIHFWLAGRRLSSGRA